ncbi:cation:proton antiporter [Paenibacillus flagellatus]|uniref:Sodium:proton exchanger n=1 Tax=Paenibacillus flagellatus TaxID=2211139 RepID=A0A2V5K531_9BACL|nr:cation:proton antiporter [Paenibacillus flagellatus]PYI53842.1 sodium:proton exchanger [Paenibacillus flagellatus]
MENETNLLIDHVLFLLILIFSLGMISGKLASVLRIPDVALFLVAGIAVGQGLHLVTETSSSFTNQFILTVGSALILFDGGRNIRLAGLKRVWVTLSLLSVPGVLLTAFAVAAASRYVLGLPWLYALLLGAIISSTDPATIIPVFRQVRIRDKVRETVESESAFNDATGSILTFSIVAVILGTERVTIGGAIVDFVRSAAGGILVGLAIGFLLSYLVAHLRLGFLRDYTTIAMIVTGLGAYLFGEQLHVSGFMATFTAGLIWGNAGSFGLEMEDKRHEMTHFSDNITVIMRMLIFVLLGSQVNFGVVFDYLLPSLAVIAVFMLIARPLTVFVCALPDRKAKWERSELLFMCWVRETGVIPAALSGMIAGAGIAHADVIAAVTFLAILLTILLQASTTALVARKLGLEERGD